MKDKTKYPDTIFCNYHSQAGDQLYGGYSDKQLLGTKFDNVEYVRADLVPRWRKITERMPPVGVDLIFLTLPKQFEDSFTKRVRSCLNICLHGWYDGEKNMFCYHKPGDLKLSTIRPEEVEKYFVVPKSTEHD